MNLHSLFICVLLTYLIRFSSTYSLAGPEVLSTNKYGHYFRQSSQTPAPYSSGTYKYGSTCVHWYSALKSIFYRGVENIQRGLPTHVIQAEFVWALNVYAAGDRKLSYASFSDMCYSQPKIIYNDTYDGAKSQSYLRSMSSSRGHIYFFSDKTGSYAAMPPLTSAGEAIADKLWYAADQKLLHGIRGGYVYGDFNFPWNIDVLYDPLRKESCRQYHKYDILDSAPSYSAPDVLTTLALASVKLNHVGAKRSSIEKMMDHLVAYIFDGVRCERMEGRKLRIPASLLHAYSRNLAFISANAENKSSLAYITRSAFAKMFSRELDVWLSFESWGQVANIISWKWPAEPKISNSMHRLLDANVHNSLLGLSNAEKIRASERDAFNTDLSGISRVNPICSEGFVHLTRAVQVNDEREQCCVEICESMVHLTTSVDPFPHESCCSRCNEQILNNGASSCPLGVVRSDEEDNDATAVVVPEFGESPRRMFTMIDI